MKKTLSIVLLVLLVFLAVACSPEVKQHTHDFKELKKIAPTCTERGYTILQCECGAQQTTDYKAALGHEWATEPTTNTAKDCTELGKAVYACVHEGCKETKTVYNVPGKHNLEEIDHKDANCTKDGYTVYGCTICKQQIEVTEKATGHSLEIVGRIEGTCITPGVTYYQCTNNCNYANQVEDSFENSNNHYVWKDPKDHDKGMEALDIYSWANAGTTAVLSSTGLTKEQVVHYCPGCGSVLGDIFTNENSAGEKLGGTFIYSYTDSKDPNDKHTYKVYITVDGDYTKLSAADVEVYYVEDNVAEKATIKSAELAPVEENNAVVGWTLDIKISENQYIVLSAEVNSGESGIIKPSTVDEAKKVLELNDENEDSLIYSLKSSKESCDDAKAQDHLEGTIEYLADHKEHDWEDSAVKKSSFNLLTIEDSGAHHYKVDEECGLGEVYEACGISNCPVCGYESTDSVLSISFTVDPTEVEDAEKVAEAAGASRSTEGTYAKAAKDASGLEFETGNIEKLTKALENAGSSLAECVTALERAAYVLEFAGDKNADAVSAAAEAAEEAREAVASALETWNEAEEKDSSAFNAAKAALYSGDEETEAVKAFEDASAALSAAARYIEKAKKTVDEFYVDGSEITYQIGEYESVDGTTFTMIGGWKPSDTNITILENNKFKVTGTAEMTFVCEIPEESK